MHVILAHENADLDALACLIAAARVYPDAVPVIGRRVSRPVRDFLAIHKDRFPVVRHGDVDGEQVTEVTVVDTRNPRRLPPVKGLDMSLGPGERPYHLRLVDHHRCAETDMHGDEEHIEPVGACATLLVEKLRAAGESVDSVEATLFLGGIYADTGSLSFSGTTARDLHAAGWLVDQGGRLDVVTRFLRTSLGPKQQMALARLIESIEAVPIGAVKVAIASVDVGEFVEGLALVVRHVLELEAHGCLLAIFDMGKRGVQVIGRSNVPYVDVGATLSTLGGGGHAGAGSAHIKGGDIETIRHKLVAILTADPPKPRTVSDIMSSPVLSVPPELPLSELRTSLTRWQHTGAPVVRDGALVGIISRRDVKKADRGGRLHLPVASCMSHEVTTVEADTPLERGLELMIAKDIGRMPVLQGQRLIGIVTRSDVLSVLYGGADAQ